ncbi:MAG: hypothetical protein F6K47_04655 [Symploca sp. SIO2E6]|nr:hypothetical protein [Symploca sp. SIO2E6]
MLNISSLGNWELGIGNWEWRRGMENGEWEKKLLLLFTAGAVSPPLFSLPFDQQPKLHFTG